MTPLASSSPRYRFVRRRWHVLFAIVDAIGWFCVRWFARLRPGRTPAVPQTAHEVRRVLLVQLDHLGDAVLTTSLLPGLRELYPRAAIDVLCAPWNYEIFSQPEVSRIFVSRWNRFQRKHAWLWPISTLYWGWKLRERHYDLAIDVRGDFSIALLMTLAGARRRVGWPATGGGFLLTDGVEYVPGRHEVESRRAVLQTLGDKSRRPSSPSFTPSPAADRFVSHMLGDFLHGNPPLLVFHIGAGTAAKMWPVEHWRELLGRVAVEFDGRVVLIGGSGDVETARAITQDQFWPGLMDWTGRLTIDQLGALLHRADAVVGGDSGPAHLAAAVGAEVVVLFSGTNDAGQWRPWGDRVQVLQQAVSCSPCYLKNCRFADHPCLRQLRPEQVIDALRSVLGGPAILSFEQALLRAGRNGGVA